MHTTPHHTASLANEFIHLKVIFRVRRILHLSSLLAAFLFFQSCQKKLDIQHNTGQSLNRISLFEIKEWIDNDFSKFNHAPTLLYSKAEQTIMNGYQVVRIPTTQKRSERGFFYFRKNESDRLEINYVSHYITDSAMGNGIVGMADFTDKSIRAIVFRNNRPIYSEILVDTIHFFDLIVQQSKNDKQVNYDEACPVEQVTRVKLSDGTDTLVSVHQDPRCPQLGGNSGPWSGLTAWQKFKIWMKNLAGNFGGGGSRGGSGLGNGPGFTFSGDPFFWVNFNFFWGYSGSFNPGVGFNQGSGGGFVNPWNPLDINPMYSVDLADWQEEILGEILLEDAEADEAYLENPCGSTLRYGNLAWKGPLEHVMIQLDYIYNHPTVGEREYKIPFAGSSGQRPGYADIVNTLTNEIFEIKPDETRKISEGIVEVGNYVNKANLFCPIKNSTVSSTWRPGQTYQPRYLSYPKDPALSIVTELVAPGVIGYKTVSRSSATQPIVIPQGIAEKLKNFLQQAVRNNNLTIKTIMQFLTENRDVAFFIKTHATTAAVTIIVATIIEDILTAGVGIADDVPCFLLAYRLVRIAAKMP
jgi:hypothetical protein